MTFDDFPGWIKEYFKRVGKYIEAKGSAPEVGTTWLEPYIEAATIDATERAKWVVADAGADDLGGSHPFISAIEDGYYKKGPYGPTTFYEENGTGAFTTTMVGTQADTVGVGTNTYSLDGAGSTYYRNSAGTDTIKRQTVASTAYRMTYDLEKSTYTLTGQFNIPSSGGAELRILYDTTSGTYVRIAFRDGGGDEFRVDYYDGVSPLTRLSTIATVTGMTHSTWYSFELTVTPTSLRTQVASLSIDETDAIPNTNRDYSLNTEWAFGSFLSTSYTSFDTFEGTA